MDDRRRLFLEALSDNAPDIDLTHSDLQERWEAIVADAHAWQAALDALDEPRRNRWLKGVNAALEVMIEALPGRSRIRDAAARALLPMSDDAWQFRVAPVTRGLVAQLPQASTVGSGPDARIVIDDRRTPRNAVAMVTGLAADAEAPALLILSVAQDGTTDAREVTGTVTDTAADGTRSLRYEAPLGDGRHRFYWGYPQAD